MRLRLWHAEDGARIAYREAARGRVVLVHSAGLSHREFEPAVEDLAHRFRLVLPDLPPHGDSEDRPRHPYTSTGWPACWPRSASTSPGAGRWSAAMGSGAV